VHGGLLVEPVAGTGGGRDIRGAGGDVAWAEWKVVDAGGAVVRSRPSDSGGEVGRLRAFETVVGTVGADGWVGVAVTEGGKERVGWVRIAATEGARTVLMRVGRSLA
jgi:hypothetical protein